MDIEKVYEFDPIPSELPVELHNLILGGEGCMWSERAPEDQMLGKVYPRLCALSTCLWTASSTTVNFSDFHEIIVRAHLSRLERLFDLQCGDGKPVVPKPNMPCIISTSMGTYCSYFPENVLSTDMATFYWSPRAPVSDDVFIIEFKSSPPMQISRLEIITGHPMGTHDRLESGVVQIRRVTETADWLTLGSFNDGRYYQSWSNMAIPVHSIRIQMGLCDAAFKFQWNGTQAVTVRQDGVIEIEGGRMVGSVPFFILIGSTTCLPGILLLLTDTGFILSISLSALQQTNDETVAGVSETDFNIIGRVNLATASQPLEFSIVNDGCVVLRRTSGGGIFTHLPTERLSDGKSSSTECLEWLIQAIECADTQIAQARAVQSKLIDRLKTIAPLNRLADDKRYWSFVDWKAHYDSPATNPRLNMDLCFIRLTLNSKRLSLPFASAQLIVMRSPPPAPEADGNLTDCKELCFQWSAPQMPKFIVDLPAKEPLLNGEGSFIQYLWMRLRDADQADSTEKTVLVDCRRFDVLDFIRPPVEQHKNTTGSYLGDAAYFNECGLAQDRRPPTTLVDGVATAAETETLKLMICADLSDVEYGRQLERSFRKLLPVLLGDGIDPAELRRIITDAQTAAFLCPFNDYEAVQCLLSDCIMADEQRCLQIQIKIIHPDTRTRLAVVDAIKYRLQLLGASILFETNDLAFELAASKFPDY